MHVLPTKPDPSMLKPVTVDDDVDNLVALIRGWGISDHARQQLVFRLARASWWDEGREAITPTDISDSEDGFSEAAHPTDGGIRLHPITLPAVSQQGQGSAEATIPGESRNATASPGSASGTITPSPALTSGESNSSPHAVANNLPASVVSLSSTVSGHHQITYQDVTFWVPDDGVDGPFYLVTRGRRVGIFSSWSRTSPYVTSVSRATFHRVKELEQGMQSVFDAVEDGQLVVV
ncbi:hypothetical protein CONPUDRAFT_155267 [Coniophora puteana RWD-64-598 SS2]|uniref:Ribonuclease H1 N-terminal domain-containing protein n=1 Tax=Coniophora puteana (strain RWD-64-598) TaxID=741705 RepID=A0A5M3MMP3_CONPW|nr:uncharacterized protein CONPUDRAFT_155267 [Coniophora puteana RWD-64-598 SS2]EIW79871.1 hypothetical protein CONPUDRAFT_155267 [Coniophora puteana RWD-64-598 SS2]